MKENWIVIARAAAIILISIIAIDALSISAKMGGVVYYTFNTPSGSWQEIGARCVLLFVSASFFIRKQTLPGRVIKLLAATCAAGIAAILSQKFYFTIAFVASGQDFQLIESTESIFAHTWGRISSMTLMFIISVLAMYEYFRKIKS